MRHLPNLLSLARLVLTPAVVYAILTARSRAALALFLAAGLSDGFDGFLARRFGWTSRLGAYLDPVADKVLLTAVYLALDAIAVAPRWLVALILGRDVMILLGAGILMLAARRRSFPPSQWGKLSTIVQVATAAFLLLHSAFPGAGGATLKDGFLWATATATAWSGIHYLWIGIRGESPN